MTKRNRAIIIIVGTVAVIAVFVAAYFWAVHLQHVEREASIERSIDEILTSVKSANEKLQHKVIP